MSDPLALISSNRFHRRVNLHTKYGSLTVSFAEIGCATGPALLFMPGMFASRYLGIPMDVMAERAGVRMIVVDRPGMGASTNVPVAQRLDAWVDIVPRLLDHLGIPRVSLVSHSAGTTYLLNTWARCRERVNPLIILLAPWVDPGHSHVTSMQMAQYLPRSAFSLWHHIAHFFVTQAGPVLASSGAVVRQMSSLSINRTEEDLSANWLQLERDYGIAHEEQAEIVRLVIRFMFDESTVGADSEVLVCLRKAEGRSWGVCDDYEEFAQTMAAREQTLGGQVSVKAYFAAKDALVGSKGQKYFEECWRAAGGEGVNFVSTTREETDHDTLVQSVAVWEEIFSLVQ
ncbi:Alpha/Beta hydrolase protein [Aspergillus unguis]